MKWPFKQKAKSDTLVKPGGTEQVPHLGFASMPQPYHQVWSRRAVPGPGAENYAYDTLALSPNFFLGGGDGIRKQFRSTSTPLVVAQTVMANGIPTRAGQIFSQPLFDTQQGMTSPRGSGFNAEMPFPKVGP